MKWPKINFHFENNERNRTIALAVLMIIALSAISLWQKGASTPSTPKPPVFADTREQVAAAMKSDPVASQQIMEGIVNKQDITNDVVKRMNITQDVSLQQIPDSKLNIQANSAQNVVNYMSDVKSKGDDYNNKIQPILTDFYNDTATSDELAQGYAFTQDMINSLYAMPVPKDALAFHKDAINIYLANADLLTKGQQVQQNNVDIWQYVYKDFALSDLASQDMQTQFTNLKQKYNLPW